MRAGRAFTQSGHTRSPHRDRERVVCATAVRRRRRRLGARCGSTRLRYDVVGVVADYIDQSDRDPPDRPEGLSAAVGRDQRRQGRSSDSSFARRRPGAARRAGSPRAAQRALVGINVNNAYTLRQMMTVAGTGISGRHGAALSAHRHRHAADVERHLRRAGVRGLATVARAGRFASPSAPHAGIRFGWSWHTACAWSLIGSTCGIALTFGLSRLVRAAGGAGSLYDPPWPAFVMPVLIVMVVAALATWIPDATRAAHQPSAAAEGELSQQPLAEHRPHGERQTTPIVARDVALPERPEHRLDAADRDRRARAEPCARPRSSSTRPAMAGWCWRSRRRRGGRSRAPPSAPPRRR